MTVQIAQKRRSVRTLVTYAVSGTEPMKADRSERRFVPDTVTIEHQGTYFSYRVTGLALKKDGSAGVGSARHLSLYTATLASEPEWLQNLVRDYCAEAGLEVPS